MLQLNNQNTQKICIFNGEFRKMLIERTNNKQITITVSSSVDSFGLQRLIDYIKYLETTAKSQAKQTDVDKLADEVNSTWWKNNSKRFIK
jgi:hypothetical protein